HSHALPAENAACLAVTGSPTGLTSIEEADRYVNGYHRGSFRKADHLRERSASEQARTAGAYLAQDHHPAVATPIHAGYPPLRKDHPRLHRPTVRAVPSPRATIRRCGGRSHHRSSRPIVHPGGADVWLRASVALATSPGLRWLCPACL